MASISGDTFRESQVSYDVRKLSVNMAKANRSNMYHLKAEQAPLNSNPATRSATLRELQVTQAHEPSKRCLLIYIQYRGTKKLHVE